MGLGSSRELEAPYTVVVTGCSSGIGEATALALDAAGFEVLAGVRKQADADRLAARGSPRLRPIILDVTNEQHVRELPAKVAAVSKGGRVGVVCNAGITLLGPWETIPTEEIRQVFEVNVFGLVAVTKALLPMVRETKGRVVLMGSVAGILSSAFLGVYSATKFAVEAIGDSLRQELAPFGAHVSIIQPGCINSSITEGEVSNGRIKKSVERSGPYEESVRRSWALMHWRRRDASPPALIAEHVLHALTAPSPKHRYRDGSKSGTVACMACLPVPCSDGMASTLLGKFEPHQG
eukprot:tig00000190_g13870.t1